MPEMSRCPNGTKCFHNKAGVRSEEQAYFRLSPPAPEPTLFFHPSINTQPRLYLKPAGEGTPRRAAPGNCTRVPPTLFTPPWQGDTRDFSRTPGPGRRRGPHRGRPLTSGGKGTGEEPALSGGKGPVLRWGGTTTPALRGRGDPTLRGSEGKNPALRGGFRP